MNAVHDVTGMENAARRETARTEMQRAGTL